MRTAIPQAFQEATHLQSQRSNAKIWAEERLPQAFQEATHLQSQRSNPSHLGLRSRAGGPSVDAHTARPESWSNRKSREEGREDPARGTVSYLLRRNPRVLVPAGSPPGRRAYESRGRGPPVARRLVNRVWGRGEQRETRPPEPCSWRRSRGGRRRGEVESGWGWVATAAVAGEAQVRMNRGSPSDATAGVSFPCRVRVSASPRPCLVSKNISHFSSHRIWSTKYR